MYRTVPSKTLLCSTFPKETTSCKFCYACSSNSCWPPLANFEICSKLYNFLEWLLALVPQSLCRSCLVFALEKKKIFIKLCSNDNHAIKCIYNEVTKCYLRKPHSRLHLSIIAIWMIFFSTGTPFSYLT